MYAVRLDPSRPHLHTHLALSFDAAGATEVLDLRGSGTISPTDLPGLDKAAASRLVADAPGGWLLQATAGALAVVGSGGVASRWEVPRGEQQLARPPSPCLAPSPHMRARTRALGGLWGVGCDP